jgi:uncharacterized membrane protein YfcA
MGAFVLSDIKQSGFYIMLTCLSLLSSIYFLFLPTPHPVSEPKEKQETKQDKRGEIRQTWELLKSKRMMKTFPLIVFASVLASIYAAMIVPILSRTMEGLELTEEQET